LTFAELQERVGFKSLSSARVQMIKPVSLIINTIDRLRNVSTNSVVDIAACNHFA
jgi:hypothetical protein